MLTILMTAQEEAAIGRESALAVGFIVAVCGFAVGPISGASMNPARTIAAQLLAGTDRAAWIYIVGPLPAPRSRSQYMRAFPVVPQEPSRKAREGAEAVKIAGVPKSRARYVEPRTNPRSLPPDPFAARSAFPATNPFRTAP